LVIGNTGAPAHRNIRSTVVRCLLQGFVLGALNATSLFDEAKSFLQSFSQYVAGVLVATRLHQCPYQLTLMFRQNYVASGMFSTPKAEARARLTSVGRFCQFLRGTDAYPKRGGLVCAP